MAAKAHSRLAALLGGDAAQAQAAKRDGCAAALRERATSTPLAVPMLCAALAPLSVSPMRSSQVLVSFRSGSSNAEAMMDAAWAACAGPAGLGSVLFIDPGDERAAAFWATHNPMQLQAAKSALTGGEGRAAAVLCAAGACQPAVYEPAAVGEAVKRRTGGASRSTMSL